MPALRPDAQQTAHYKRDTGSRNPGRGLTITPDSSKATNRFPRSSRLTDAPGYSRVFNQSHRSRDNLFTVLFSPNDHDQPRLGLAIAKKHCKLATARNRIKRLVRESFRQNRNDLQGFDIVVMNTRATHDADNATLHRSLERHWRRIARNRRRAHPD